MKRLWIRAHALERVQAYANEVCVPSPEITEQGIRIVLAFVAADDNDMVVVEISDELADAIQRNNFLRASGKILAENESPPYVGSDPPLSEEELRTEVCFDGEDQGWAKWRVRRPEEDCVTLEEFERGLAAMAMAPED